MVFRYAQGVTTINGVALIPESHLESNYERLGKHLLLSKEQARAKMAPEHRQKAMKDVDATEDAWEPATLANLPDPVGAVDLMANLDAHERQRIIHTSGAYVDTWLTQIAAMLDERAWLNDQLADPRWEDHPSRPGAIAECARLAEEAQAIAEFIAWSEAWADRCWQSLAPADRAPVAHMWLTNPQDTRLVTRAWRDQAHFGISWPQGAFVDAVWFVGLPDRLYIDLTPLWQHGPTWLGEPVEPDTTARDDANAAFARTVASRLH